MLEQHHTQQPGSQQQNLEAKSHFPDTLPQAVLPHGTLRLNRALTQASFIPLSNVWWDCTASSAGMLW